MISILHYKKLIFPRIEQIKTDLHIKTSNLDLCSDCHSYYNALVLVEKLSIIIKKISQIYVCMNYLKQKIALHIIILNYKQEKY